MQTGLLSVCIAGQGAAACPMLMRELSTDVREHRVAARLWL